MRRKPKRDQARGMVKVSQRTSVDEWVRIVLGPGPHEWMGLRIPSGGGEGIRACIRYAVARARRGRGKATPNYGTDHEEELSP